MLSFLCRINVFLFYSLHNLHALFPTEEAQIPKRKSEMGSAAAASDLKQMNDLSRDWPEIVPRTPLRPGYEDTRMNYRNVRPLFMFYIIFAIQYDGRL